MDTDTTAPLPGAKAGRREWIGLAVIALPCLLYAMDVTVLLLAVPQLSADLGPSSSQLLWIVDIYGFLVAGFLITMGTLGDRIGRRRLLLIGAAAFGVASVFAAFSTSAEMLIATRALLGVAGATLAPSTLSLIRNMFHDPRQRSFAIGLWIASFSAGGAVGPLFGGLLLEHFWWGSAFLLGVPVMLLLLVVGPVLLPESRDPDAGRIDLVSVALSLAAVLSLIYGVKRAAEAGLGWRPGLLLVVGLGLGALFLRRQRTLADPLIDLGLFRAPAFSAALTTNTLGFFIAFGASPFIAQYLQLVHGLSPLEAGLWTMPEAGGFVVGSMVTPSLARRARPAYVMAAGLVLAAAGFALMTRVTGPAPLAVLVAGSVAFALGLATVFTLTADMVVGTAPPERAGAAAAINETSSELGGALGLALLGSVSTAVYRSGMADGVPAGVAAGPADVARETLGGAVTVSGQLPGSLGAELLDAAQAAFTVGLQLTAGLSAAIAVGIAALTVVLLRHVRPAGEAPDSGEAAPGIEAAADPVETAA